MADERLPYRRGERRRPGLAGRTCRFRLGIVLFALAFVGCTVTEDRPHQSDFRVGMPRSEILGRFGPPDHKQTLRKTFAGIFGPVEEFWPRVRSGAKVEIWSYRSTRRTEGSSEVTSGATELYFVDDKQTVDGIGFAPEGAVY